MSHFAIQLDEPDAAFQPGDDIRGTVLWENLDSRPESIAVRLLWTTRGKGDRDYEVVQEQVIASPGTTGEDSFRFTAPRYPNSLTGVLLSVIWMIEAILLPARHAEQLEIVIAPGKKPVAIGDHDEDNEE